MRTQETAAAIQEQLQNNFKTDVSLINIEDSNVMELSVPFVLATPICPEDRENIDDEDNYEDPNAGIISYDVWRRRCLAQLTYSYDRRRFERSTLRSTLRSKVLDHKRYSFIVRTQDTDGFDHVYKYSFQRLDDKAQQILCTCKEVSSTLEHDMLTGGLSRAGLLRELAERFRSVPTSVDLVLLYFNIDNFRLINERYGSEVGDKVLQSVYTNIVYSDLKPKSYARTESDKFIFLVNKKNLDMKLIERLCHQDCIVDQIPISFRCVCGILNITDRSISPAQACSRAQLATTFIKDHYLNPWIVYEEQMQKSSLSETEILDELDNAIANREFIPYFQPIVEVKTGRIEMAEALVRWKSSKHGMVSPGVFIPVLERHGGLSRVDAAMEQQVFELQKERTQKGLPTVPTDINLSWTDFADVDFMTQIREHLTGPDALPAGRICLEITESTLAEFADNRQDILSFFKEQGVKLLIDDFGQAYSFGTMRDVDFYIIKLDKSLIDQIGDSRKADLLVECLIGMFHKMNAKVVAEGVETAAQAQYLKMVGCDYIQGFYFYRPMEQSKFLELLEKQELETPKEQPQSATEQPDGTPSDENSAGWVEREILEQQFAQLQQSVEAAKCLRMLLEEQGIFYFEWDIKTHIDVASDRFCQMYGLRDNAIPNMPEEAALTHPDDAERFKEFYYRAERGELMGNDYFRIINPDGKSYSWYRKTFYTLFGSDYKPYKVIMTMQNCSDKYNFTAMLERNDLLIRQQEIITFIYTLGDDTLTFNMLGPDGETMRTSIPNYTQPGKQNHNSQLALTDIIKYHIASKNASKTGYFDFYNKSQGTEMRAHYAHVYGEYGHLYAIVGQAENINKTRERLQETIRSQQELLQITQSLQSIYNGFAYIDLVNNTSRIMIIDPRYADILNDEMDWKTITKTYAEEIIKPAYKENWLAWIDPATINERMGQKSVIMAEYEDKQVGWTRSFLIPSSRDEAGNLTSFLFTSMPIGEEKSTMERLIHLSEFDGLTQIRNRFSGEQQIEKMLQQRKPGIFGIIDYDDFKHINDTLGHASGDYALVSLARGMELMNPNGINLRLGGDEFAFFIEGTYSRAEIEKTMQVLFDHVSHVSFEGHEEEHFTISIGVIQYDGTGPSNFDAIYRLADPLLYQSKNFGGNQMTMG